LGGVTARLVIAGASSGAGKTTVTCGLARALCARGLHVALFKCGPDYLDPTYHARALRTHRGHNLDGWMMGRDAVLSTFARVASGADVALCEGMMGLFDGASATTDTGSTAEIAKWLAAPVLLCVDASAMARSIAALAHGYATFDPALQRIGVVANRVGGRGHLQVLKVACSRVAGGLPEEREWAFPERHLGLQTAGADSEARLDAWGRMAAEWLDIDAILALARSAPPLAVPACDPPPERVRCRIGYALDDAFHFYYEDNLRRLEAAGAELIPFSPIADAQLPAVQGLYFGGGYPELFAPALAGNRSMRQAVRAFSGPMYGECGGLMYLCEAIRTTDGARHEMVGRLRGEAVMAERLRALGYIEVETRVPTLLGPAGLRFRGHQFRYSELAGAGSENAFAQAWADGSLLASYVHGHWASCPAAPRNFVAACCS
jgi:cobyrinic acid a,c-diamide synthase